MQLLKSLFCLHGFDNRTRFFIISFAVYVIFIMLTSTFKDNISISLTILVLSSSILGFTNLRRINDAKINIKWLITPSILFVLFASIIIFSKQNNYYLLIIPSSFLTILLTYPSINIKNSSKLHYILGYFGPVDMTEYQERTHQSNQEKHRIEPSLMNNDSENSNSNNLSASQQSILQSHEKIAQNEKKQDLGELVRLKLLKNRKAQLIIATIIVIISVSVCASWLITYFQSNKPSEKKHTSQLVNNSHNVLERNSRLDMPNNFSLFLSQHQGIIINWQADEVATPLLWSQSSAKGDESCQQIIFNKDSSIRTLIVKVEKNTTVDNEIYNNYFAIFSPLDSKSLIQALAFRSSFSLCGYDFSLKGSQATLSKNKPYANWINY